MSIEINITDNIVQVTPTEQQVDINITENPIEVNVTDEIVLIAQTGLQGPAGPGVAIGGTAGQILAKNSSTNYDTLWINNAVGTVTSVATSSPLTGGTITSSGTIGITQSSASGDGYLSSTDWTTFNNKQNALTNPITGTGTINYVPKFTSLNGIDNSLIYDNGSNVSIASTSSLSKLNISNKLLLFDTTPTNAYSATKMGYTFASNGAAWSTPAGSIIEDTANGTILSYAVNMAQVGTVKSAYSGGIFRFDTRPGEDRFIVLGRPVGSFIEFVSFYVDLNTGSTYLNPVYGSTLIGTSVNAGYKLDVNGTTRLNGVTTIGTINAATTDTDRFLVSDSGVIKYRTGSQILSDIGGQGALTLTTTGTSGAATLIGNTLNVPQYEAEGNYVTTATTLTINGTTYDLSANRSWSVGTVTSVGLSMPVAFSVANTPITSSGTLAVTAVGTSSQYIRGDGQLATLPSGSSGGSSVNYYLNGSVAASVAGYQQMANSAVIGAGTDFALVGNGLIAQFLTDVANPNRLLIPGGAWNFEMYFNVSSSGGNAKFYVELLKYDGTTFTSIASSSAVAEEITGGTTIDLYITSLAVPETVLLTSDRLAVRVYIVDNSGGRTVTLHTENNSLCEIITTFAGGIAALNGLTDNTQYFAVGTAGTDFAISSVTDTHTFNLPTASATNRGALSSADWTTFNNKPNVNIYTGDGTLTGNRIVNNDIYSLTFNGGFNIKHNTQSALFSTFYGAGSDGFNIFIGGGGLSSGTGGGASSNGSYNTAVGVDALLSNTTGYQNIANGYNALYSNTTGYQNTGNGVDTLFDNTTGYQNIANGYNALYFNTTGYQNTANGANALRNNTTGYQNIANGYNALNSNTTGNNNTANGVGALLNNTTGICNSSVGASSLRSNTTGSNNIALGFNAGRFIADLPSANTITNNSIFIGYDTKAAENNQTNQIVIGYEETGLGSNTTIIGNSSTVTTALRGRLILGTTTDNGVNQLQVTGTALFSSSVTASSLIKSGGTSTQFLKADGSVDSTTYGTFTLPSLTAGSVLFSNGTTIAEDNANFFWDDTNNRLGIGTASPVNKLTVQQSASSDGIRIIGNSGGFASLDIQGDRATGNLGGLKFSRTGDANSIFELLPQADRSAVYFALGNGGSAPTTRVAITQAGNVLIGSTTDDTINKLQVSGSANITGNLTVDTNTLFVDAVNNRVGIGTASPAEKLDVSGIIKTNTQTGKFLLSTTDTIGATQSIEINNSVGDRRMILGFGNTSSDLMLVSNDRNADMAFRTNATERMRITSGGNVGIGTASPNNKLDVIGKLQIADGGSLGFAGVSSLNIYKASSPTISFYDNVDHSARIGLVSVGGVTYGALAFFVGATTPERMRITSGGNVLIGTTTDAGYKLDTFSGAVRFTHNTTLSRNRFVNDNSGNPQIDIAIGKSNNSQTLFVGVNDSQDTLPNSYINSLSVPLYIRGTGGTNFMTSTIFNGGLANMTFARVNASTMSRFQWKTASTIDWYLGYRGTGSTSKITWESGSGGVYHIFPTTNNFAISNTNDETDISSSILFVNSTTKGFLPPRMTTTQKNAIASPVAGLVVYDTTLNKLCVRTASAWETITSI